MGLLDGLTPIKPGEPCKVGRVIKELDTDDSATLILALEDERWTHRALAHALTARGVNFATDTIRAHRENTCRCSKI